MMFATISSARFNNLNHAQVCMYILYGVNIYSGIKIELFQGIAHVLHGQYHAVDAITK
jgi:hypothetical protein